MYVACLLRFHLVNHKSRIVVGSGMLCILEVGMIELICDGDCG